MAISISHFSYCNDACDRTKAIDSSRGDMARKTFVGLFEKEKMQDYAGVELKQLPNLGQF